MKKNILLAATALLLSVAALAGPAKPGRITFTQPDGSTVGVYLHGDEYYHWMTDENGNTVAEDENGYLKVVPAATASMKDILVEQANVKRSRSMAAIDAAAATTSGSPKIPVLLIGFKDKNFSKTAAQFNAMLNTPGYSDNGAIGSVFDYYNENSFGKFQPQFDVLGPVNVDNNLATYGTDNAPKLLKEACDTLDAQGVDFSQYDNDGDKVVDFVIFYFAGYDQAQTGVSTQIWSHAYSVAGYGYSYDNVSLAKYFCTAELKGSSGSTMCSIGPTCHEFAHTLGLPDFYDTRYQEGDSDTEAANMYKFDVMAEGPYNGDSTTPPYFNAEEALEVGWLDAIPEITSNGAYTLPAINYQGATKYSAYMSKTGVNNEYFVYETRGGQRWDASLPSGLLVYHVDRSTNKVSGSRTAASMWSNNTVNGYAAHPCCFVIPASDPTSIDLYSGSLSKALFGIGSNAKAFSPVAWSGNSTAIQLSNITSNTSTHVTTFNVVNSNALGIAGTVLDSEGNPIAGATVTVSSGSLEQHSLQNTLDGRFSPAPKKAILSSANTLRTKAEPLSTTTDASGYYSIDLEESGTYNVTASKSGFVSKTATVSVTSMIETLNLVLLREGETLPDELATFPEDAEFGNYGNDQYDSWDLLVSNIYPTSYIGAYAGKQIKTVSFMAGGTSIDNCTLVVDFGNTRALALALDEPELDNWVTVDVSEHELIIPDSKDVYVGYGGNITGNYPIWATTAADSELIGYMADFDVNDLQTVAWEAWDGYVFAIKMTVGDYVKPDTGYNFIEDPKNGSYSAGDVLDLVLIETTGARKPASEIEWIFDDEPVSGTSVTLSSGSHVIEARFTTESGDKKVIELELEVN